MLKSLKFRAGGLVIAGCLLAVCPATRAAQDNGTPAAKPDSAPKTVKLIIQVLGGDEKKPVESASVYVKYVEARKIAKDKQIEMNLKTNLAGSCRVPEIPAGKILIQVIAPGWKTFGEYYDVDQAEQTINIALVRPPKWY
jgi:hypothetical protein